MFPRKIFQNIDILAKIHGNVFLWQPTIMGNKASYYKSMFQISLPWLYLSFHNSCPRHLKSRRDLLYGPGKWIMEARICPTNIGIRVTNAEILVCEAWISEARMNYSLKDVLVNTQVIQNQNQLHRNEQTNHS